jgi:hypothetical protein
MRRVHVLVFIIALSVSIFSGCAVGNKYNYHETVANLQPEGTLSVGVAVQDQRIYILTKQKEPNFVGLQRGGWGNPFDVTTLSGNSLADDMSNAITASLNKRGYKAISVDVSHVLEKITSQNVLENLKSKKADRFVLLVLNEWKSDTMTNVAFTYNVGLIIYDHNGEELATAHIKGRDNLKGSAMNPPAHAMKVIPIAFKEKIEELFRNEDIIRALQMKKSSKHYNNQI